MIIRRSFVHPVWVSAPRLRPAWYLLILPLVLLVNPGQTVAAPVGAPAQVQVSQVVAKGTDLTAYVRVQDEAGASLPGIAASALKATIGDQAATVQAIAPFADTGEGVTYLFLVDVSQSIAGQRFEQLRKALRAWVAALNPADRAGVIAFGSEIRTLVEPTADRSALNTAIDALVNKDRQTRLHGALIRALDLAHRQAPGMPDRRAIVVFSDGLDDAPGDVTAAEVLTRLADDRVPIYAIAFGKPHDKTGLDALGQFARRSGGAVLPTVGGDPGPDLAAMRERIRTVYRVALGCPGCTADGKSYRVQVALSAGGLTLADGMDVRLYPAAEAERPAAPVAPAAPAASSSPGAPAAPPPAVVPVTDAVPVWFYIAAAAGGLLVLVLLVVWVLRRRRVPPVVEPVPVAVPSPAPLAPTVAASVPKAPVGPPITLAFRTGPRRGQSVRLVLAPDIVLGRDPACTLVLADDDQVSGRHARLKMQGKSVLLEDLGSTNGTALNGVAIHALHPVGDGDLMRLGDTELRIGLAHGSDGRGVR